MKKIFITLFALVISDVATAQSQNNVFKTFEEYKSKQPTDYVEFELKKRTDGNVFMTGGITNYRLKKINPKTRSEEMTNNIWGVLANDSLYINSFPYSQIIGLNKIIGEGYYTYFIGEPARSKDKQVDLGIIKQGDAQKAVCCRTSYVILPGGEVKWLTPELLNELIADNQKLATELKDANLQQEDAFKMFGFLKQYNEMQK